MGIFDFFRRSEDLPELTEAIVKQAEKQSETDQKYLELMKRYARAIGVSKVSKAEAQHVWELGNAIAGEQVKTIQQNSRQAIGDARQKARQATITRLSSYAKNLALRSAKDD